MNIIPVLQPGEIEEDRPMPSLNHSIVCSNLSGLIFPMRATISHHQQLNLDLGGWKSIPDFCLYRREGLPHDWLNDQDEVTIPPVLIVEVLSPKQNTQPLIEKVREYLRRGVQTCWVVAPNLHAVSIFPANGPSSSIGSGVLRDDNLGFEMRVEDIFS